MQTSEPELRALMIAARDGDARAYRALLGDLRVRLVSYFARRLRGAPDEVDDLTQDTLIAIHTRRATYDVGLALTPWVYAIARYKLVDHYRRAGRRVHVSLDDAVTELTVDDESASVNARRDVEAALSQLPPRARALLASLKIEGDSVEEAAVRFDMSASAVKVASHRAMKALNARYGPKEGEDD